MQSLCKLDLCVLAADIIAGECSTPNFTIEKPKAKGYENARYLYVFFCANHINAPFPLIRRTMPIYQNEKTVYQVFRRMYFRRKDEEVKSLINYINQEYNWQLKELAKKEIFIREEGKQINLFKKRL